MAALALQLEIQGSSNFTFLVPPRFEPRRELRWKRASNPPEVEEILDTWNFKGGLLVSTDGTVSTLLAQFAAFQARFQTRGSEPAYVRLTRDPAGSNTPVLTLGPGAGYEQLRFEVIEAGSSPLAELAAATWQVAIPVDLTVSAVLKRPDTNGIVGWAQRVRQTYDEAGLLLVEWETTVTTAEETDARDKAREFGLIPIAAWGDSYSYLTNGDDGVEVDAEDADEANSRVPTIATGTCRIRQWGVSVGTVGPGLSPTSIEVEIVTDTDLRKGEETITRTATAVGPGAQGWAESQDPGGIGAERMTRRHKRATRVYEIEWIQKRKLTKEDEDVTKGQIKIQVSGGGQGAIFEPACGGFLPVKFSRPRQPWTTIVEFAGESSDALTAKDLPLPPLLDGVGDLVFDPLESFEDAAPWVEEKGTGDKVTITYKRNARAVYRSALPPPRDIAELLGRGFTPSWYLE